jgi:hypothetical protein
MAVWVGALRGRATCAASPAPLPCCRLSLHPTLPGVRGRVGWGLGKAAQTSTRCHQLRQATLPTLRSFGDLQVQCPYFGPHSRAIFCASAICAGVILVVRRSRLLAALAPMSASHVA